MLWSSEQNVKHRNGKTVNKSSENEINTKYLGWTVTNQNFIIEETKKGRDP